MPDAPDWPAYPVGPKDSIFAIEVVSIKFAELKSTLCFIFCVVFDIAYETATRFVAKIRAEAAVTLIRQELTMAKIEWPEPGRDHLEHFVEGFRICLANRNDIMHSGVAWASLTEKTVLYKTSKQGRVLMSSISLTELQRIADAMNDFAIYGRNVGNAVNNRRTGQPIFPFPWPDKPALPQSMDHSPNLRPI